MRPIDSRICTQVRTWDADPKFNFKTGRRMNYSTERNHLSSTSVQHNTICYTKTGAFCLEASMDDKLQRVRRAMKFDGDRRTRSFQSTHLFDIAKSIRGFGKLFAPEARIGYQAIDAETKIENKLDDIYPGTPIDVSIIYK
jgi:hypothetical protein